MKVAYGEEIVGKTQIFESFFELKSGVISVEDAHHSGFPMTSRTNDSVD
jgi:hypothetical protein